jgi:hypothetical protein
MNAAPAKSVTKSSEPRVSCRVPPKLMNRLIRIAKANGMDVSDVVRMSLYRILPSYEQANKNGNGKAQPA